uniref:50S ribosomal protein L13 n=1 Tax=Strombidium inclinatum TaxID=197538 RepID=A0A7S3N0I6_9SPIT|mmetsp:Transcript_29524/g.44909  ORF Transcript_29524/g.44909 Transcript_29524/m.44909 type:complete len:170 (+) Transcript_29524:643-1152(+)
MKEPFFTGDKANTKLYRHYTGFPGGLREFTVKEVLQKKPERILLDAVKGMLPKNKLKKDLMEKHIKVFDGPYHTYHNILPQFTEPLPHDINEHMGLNGFDPENNVIKYKETEELPPELEGIPEELDLAMDEPLYAKRKTHTEDSYNYKIGRAYRRSHKGFKKFKLYKQR